MIGAKAAQREASHARIVDAAAETVRRLGYEGVGVAEVMKSVGMTHGGFYAHFENRDALLVEAVTRAGENSTAKLSAAIARSCANGMSRLQALVTAYLSDAHAAAPDAGCPVAALIAEMPRQAESVQSASRARVTAFVKLVASNLPPHRSGADAESLACGLVGALQMARTLDERSRKRFLTRQREHLLALYS
jgi:AcrR family transcriptional regulator